MIPPTTWLWDEIERRFGQEAAAQLRNDFNDQMKRYEREQRCGLKTKSSIIVLVSKKDGIQQTVA